MRRLVDSIAMALERSVKCLLIQCCAAAVVAPVANYAMQWSDHCLNGASIDSNLLSYDQRRVFCFDHFQPDDAIVSAADEYTELPTKWVCCRLIQNVMNCRYFLLTFHLTNWNAQQIDSFVKNDNRLVAAAADVMVYFALAAVAAAAQIKDPKKCPTNPKRIVAPGRIAGTVLVTVAEMMMMMIKDQMKKLNSKNSAETE